MCLLRFIRKKKEDRQCSSHKLWGRGASQEGDRPRGLPWQPLPWGPSLGREHGHFGDRSGVGTVPCWRDPCPPPCQHSGSPGHGDGGQCQHRCLPAAGLSEAPREGERIAHLPPRLRSSSARSAEGQRDGWTWQSTVCGLRPSRVDVSPPTQEDPHAQPHTPPAVVSAPFA